ncbi:MAG: hypothetical protein WKG06_01925 [Segetibacter sp.]
MNEEKRLQTQPPLPVEEKRLHTQPPLPVEEKDPYAPTMVEMPNSGPAIIKPAQQYYQEQQPEVLSQQAQRVQQDENPVLRFELKPEIDEKQSQSPNKNQPQAESNVAATFWQ